MEWTETARRLPGPAATGPLSPFAALSDAGGPRAAASVGPTTPPPLPAPPLDLGGLWERAVDPAAATTTATADGPPPSGAVWEPAVVPQNYGVEPRLRRYFGPVWYRRDVRRPPAARFVDLELGAVDHLVDVAVGGRTVGRHEGYATPIRVDLSELLPETGAPVELRLRVQDPLESPLPGAGPFPRKRWAKGTLSQHDSRRALPAFTTDLDAQVAAQQWPTGGVVGPVSLRVTGDVRVDAVFVTPLDREGRVHVCLLLTNRTDRARRARAVLTLVHPDGRVERDALDLDLEPGAARVDLAGAIDDPVLWYDVALAELGGPARYAMHVTLVVDDAASDARTVRFGIRTAEFPTEPRFHYVLNGEPLFVRAVNYMPIEHWAGVGVDFYERDLRLVAAANLHSVGVHGHVQSPAMYEAADRVGISVFQDFSLAWSYDSGTATNPGFVERTCAQAAETVYSLWNHPSVVYWCAHNEPPFVLAHSLERRLDPGSGRRADCGDDLAGFVAAAHLGFTAEALDPAVDVANLHLDRAVAGTIRTIDPLRSCHLASGTGIDVHDYTGSLGGGSAHDVVADPQGAPFVSEYGAYCVSAAAVSDLLGDGPLDGWPPDDEQLAWLLRGTIPHVTTDYVGGVGAYPNLVAFAHATERWAAFVARLLTEHYRIHRDEPYTGFRWHFFVDHWGHVGAGLLDVRRRPTRVYHALRDASRPRLVTTTAPSTIVEPGRSSFPIFAVNDTRAPWDVAVEWRVERVAACEVVASCRPGRGDNALVETPFAAVLAPPESAYALAVAEPLATVDRGELCGRVGAGATVRLGEVEVELTDPGPYRIALRWPADEVGAVADNDYPLLVAAACWRAQPGTTVVLAQATIDCQGGAR